VQPSQQMAEIVKEEVRQRRPLIVSWLELADFYRQAENILIFQYPKAQSIAFESLSRPTNKKILEDIGKELGFEILVARVG
jgi:hypothetical protein